MFILKDMIVNGDLKIYFNAKYCYFKNRCSLKMIKISFSLDEKATKNQVNFNTLHIAVTYTHKINIAQLHFSY